MKHFKILLGAAAISFAALLILYFTQKEVPYDEDFSGKVPEYDWFEQQRAYPFPEIPNEERLKAIEHTKKYIASDEQAKSSLWTLAGPMNVEGRITTLAIDPMNTQIVYAGCANGGVWKSTDFCQSWVSVFDNQNTSSIGALAINPLSSGTLLCGTGEVNSLRSYYPGTGVYKSTHSGLNWISTGLQNTYSIGNIAINPLNPNEVYAAAMGSLRHNNPERGVYKSTDGGSSWTQSLFVADSVGAVDVVIDPVNPQRVFAAIWERTRRENYIKYGGPKSALYLTTNSGQNWSVVTGGFPSNTTTLGRISLDINTSNPQVIYALLAGSSGGTMGLYKSTNGGGNWFVANASAGNSSNYAWFNRIVKCNPQNANQVFCGGLYMEISSNGGTSFGNTLYSIHVDHHAVCFAPSNPNYIVMGNDGGITYSSNGGAGFNESPMLPVTQFYAGDVSFQNPDVMIGGAQDNGTNMTQGNVNTWNEVYGGDGFYCLIDYQNPQNVYASSQNAGLGRSVNGGASFTGATTGLDITYTNWSTPLVMDKNNPQVLYCGTYKVHRSTNGAQSWTAISPDLAKAHVVNLGTITTLDVSKSNPAVIYAGTDDANVWVTTNGGGNWTLINAGLPNRWVTRLTVHPDSANVCYVTLSGYKVDSTGAHIFGTVNYGSSWTAINGNLPNAPINDVIIDPLLVNTLYIGTDIGVYITRNLGQSWSVLGGGLPSNVPVHDLTLHTPTRKLTAWTHGRSAFKIDLNQAVVINPVNETASEFSLMQNYPNPFNAETKIKFSVPASQYITLKVYDAAGRMVSVLTSGNYRPGEYSIRWNAAGISSGIYYYRMEGKGYTEVKKLIIIK